MRSEELRGRCADRFTAVQIFYLSRRLNRAGGHSRKPVLTTPAWSTVQSRGKLAGTVLMVTRQAGRPAQARAVAAHAVALISTGPAGSRRRHRSRTADRRSGGRDAT